MSTPLKLGAFALALSAVFAASVGLGSVVGPIASTPATHEDADHERDPANIASHLPGGLQVAEDGYRLAPLTTALSTGPAAPFRFRIIGPDGLPLTRYTTSHDRDLHLIVVRRDLTGFQHLHPHRDGDGVWSVPLAVGAAGQYRVFADFRPAGRAEGLTLGVDLPAPGDYRPQELPAPQRTAIVDGYTVTFGGDLTPGTASKLILSVTRDGVPVTDLQPYLGAYGHLVALRDGDLAYLHVHPDGAPGDGRTASGPEITFFAEVPTAGGYRLYLDFQHAGTVRTAEFTAVAGAPSPAEPRGTSGPATPSPTGSTDGHDAPDHTHS